MPDTRPFPTPLTLYILPTPSLFSSGLDHVSCALPLHDLAVNLQSQRRDLEAEIMFRRAVQVRPHGSILRVRFLKNMNIKLRLSFLLPFSFQFDTIFFAAFEFLDR